VAQSIRMNLRETVRPQASASKHPKKWVVVTGQTAVTQQARNMRAAGFDHCFQGGWRSGPFVIPRPLNSEQRRTHRAAAEK